MNERWKERLVVFLFLSFNPIKQASIRPVTHHKQLLITQFIKTPSCSTIICASLQGIAPGSQLIDVLKQLEAKETFVVEEIVSRSILQPTFST